MSHLLVWSTTLKGTIRLSAAAVSHAVYQTYRPEHKGAYNSNLDLNFLLRVFWTFLGHKDVWIRAFPHFSISSPSLDIKLLRLSSLPPPSPRPLVISPANLNLQPLWVGCTSGSYFTGNHPAFHPVRWQVLRDINHLFPSGEGSQALEKTC